jgi:hypothetical protein
MLNFIIENIKIFSTKSLFHGRHKANPAELLKDFKKNVRNKVAHGIVINGKVRWCDHSLQDVSILACEVIVCLGRNYEVALSNKENIDKEIVRRWVNKASCLSLKKLHSCFLSAVLLDFLGSYGSDEIKDAISFKF